jgi:hypothetical protein
MDVVTSEVLDTVKESAAQISTESQNTQRIIQATAASQTSEFIAEQTITREEVINTRNTVEISVESLERLNRKEHEVTRAEMEKAKKEAEEQVKKLTEEIRLLKIEIEDCVKKVVASVGKVSESKQKKLQEVSNAKFNLWVAKEIILKKLLVSFSPYCCSIELLRSQNSVLLEYMLIPYRTSLRYSSSTSRRSGNKPWIFVPGRSILIQSHRIIPSSQHLAERFILAYLISTNKALSQKPPSPGEICPYIVP